MGLYINPQTGSKEQWLRDHATPIGTYEAMAFTDFSGSHLPVCLVNNGAFTAAAICDTHEERNAFGRNDGRPKSWFLASKDKLTEFM